MLKVPSKFLNLTILANLIRDTGKEQNIDGALILTSFGFIIGKIDIPDNLNDKFTILNFIASQKTSVINNSNVEGNDPIELMGDGSMLIVTDAVIKYANNSTISINQITLHCDQIIGFAPVNIQDYLDQCTF
ncbi:hypothetical protein [Clostridium tagluense]|uniref:hypothetical protein n=1 Tax=Clostridium tagluense TaxID=360422 RepID=UPI001CF304E8|nr:hypothetical protein [Clostridium tagluense]MCB2297813.1 hypothetical protein [Clostridium tagluense]